MSAVDPVAEILAGLDGPVDPRAEFAQSLLVELLAELRTPVARGRRARWLVGLGWLLPKAPPRLRLVLVIVLLFLLLAGIATATYFGVRATMARNGSITLVGPASISSIGPDGRLHTLVRCTPSNDCGTLESMAWAPDGTRLAYTVDNFAAITSAVGLHILDTNTGKDRHVPSGRLGCVAPFDLDWSRDGSRIAYACEPGLYDEGGIYVINGDGSGRTLLRTRLSGRVSFPSWSPDGRRIVLAVARNRRSFVYVIDLDGAQRTLLAVDAAAPAWSPDGKRIAYRATCRGIKLITPTGKDVTPINGPFRCNAIGVSGVPAWSPDGTKIAIATLRNGTYVIDADGTHLTRLTKETGGVPPAGLGRPSWQPVPDTNGTSRGG